MNLFLAAEELADLTGFHRRARQIEQLRLMGIPFFVNGAGRAVVARSAIDGKRDPPLVRTWVPAVVKYQRPA